MHATLTRPARVLRGVLAAAGLAAAMALAAGPTAGGAASSTASQEGRVAQVMAQIDRLDAERATAVARETAAVGRLAAAHAKLASTRSQLDAARSGLTAVQTQLAQQLVAEYKRDNGDTAGYLLAAGSLTDLLDRVDAVNRMSDATADVMVQVRKARTRLESAQAAEEADVRAASAALASARSARADVESLLADRQATLAAVSARVRTGITHEQHRRQTLATDTHSVDPGGSAQSGAVFYGDATWYGWVLAGHITSSGEVFDPMKLTCANPWLPFGTLLKVTLDGRSVVVKVNDRGPFGGGVIDLSLKAAQDIGLYSIGRARVRVEVVGSAPINA